MEEALEICQSDQSDSGGGVCHEVGWCVQRVCRTATPGHILPQHLCWVGPLLPSQCPAPSWSLRRTYQEHKDDGALVNIVHQVTGLLAKPAPAKMERL